MTRICTKCNIEKPLEEFYEITRSGNVYRRRSCAVCDSSASNKQARLARLDSSKRGKWILEDSRRSDKKCGRKNDLDRAFIDGMLVKDCCSYCGEDRLKLVLDRRDNDLGHLKDNVILSCIRCNDIRNNMPYDAWQCLVPCVKAARDSGAFESWRNKKYVPRCELCGVYSSSTLKFHRAADNWNPTYSGYRVVCERHWDSPDCYCSFCYFKNSLLTIQ